MSRTPTTVWRLVAVTIGVWWQTSARLLRGRRRRNLAVVVVAVGVAAWCVVASRSIDPGINSATGNDELVFQSLVLIVLVLGLIVSAVANLYLSGATVLDSIVAVLPVSAFERLLANRVATAVVATVVTTSAVTPLVWPLLTATRGVNHALGGAALMTVLLIGIALGQASSLATLVMHQRWLPAAPAAVAEQRAGMVSACVAVVAFGTAYRDVATGGDGGGPMRHSASIVRRASDGSVGHLALVAASFTAASLVVVVLAWRAARSRLRHTEQRSVALAGAVRATPLRWRPVMLETAVWARNPYNRGTLGVLVIGGACTLVLTTAERSASSPVLLAATLPGVAALIGASVFGATCAWHWVYSSVGRPTRWVAPKLTAAVFVWGVVIVPVAGLGALAGAWGAGVDAGVVVGLSSIQFTSVVITGLWVPATTAHSMQALSNFFLTITVSTVSLPILLALPVVGDSGVAVAAAGLTLAGLCVVLYRQRAVADDRRSALRLA